MGGCSVAFSHHRTDSPSPPRQHIQGSTIRYSSELEPKRKVIVIGVGGASGSGKSSLAEALAVHFASPLEAICGDEYFMPEKMPVDSKFGRNFETPQGVDFELLRSEVQRLVGFLGRCTALPASLSIETAGGPIPVLRTNAKLPEDGEPVVVVVEGFLLFADPEVVPLFQFRLWLDIDCDSAAARRWRRRMKKREQKEQPPSEEFLEWYRQVVWFHHLKFKSEQMINANPYALQALQPPEVLLQAALEHVGPMLLQDSVKPPS